MAELGYAVRLTTDKAEIYAFLARDPVLAAYAMGDLAAAHFAFCTWWLAEQQPGQPEALALVYRRLHPPILLTLGAAAGVAAICRQARSDLPSGVAMAGQPEHLPALEALYDFGTEGVQAMWRMTVSPDGFRSGAAEVPVGLRLRRLGAVDGAAIEALISAGGPFAPDSFSAIQVAEGVFYGLEERQTGGLVAVAGTHLVVAEGQSGGLGSVGDIAVAAVGNVYTHPARRGRGYGRIVSSAVTAELLDRGLLVVLNVNQDNKAAIHIYEKLGYRVHCPFYEGIGELVGGGW